MSEMTNYLGDISAEEALIKFEGLTQSVLDGFKDLNRDCDVFIDTVFGGYLVSRTGTSTYDYLPCGDFLGDTRINSPCSDRLWRKFLERSYRVVFDKGALPYAHRS